MYVQIQSQNILKSLTNILVFFGLLYYLIQKNDYVKDNVKKFVSYLILTLNKLIIYLDDDNKNDNTNIKSIDNLDTEDTKTKPINDSPIDNNVSASNVFNDLSNDTKLQENSLVRDKLLN